MKDLHAKAIRLSAALEVFEQAKHVISHEFDSDDVPSPTLTKLEALGAGFATFREAFLNTEKAAFALEHSFGRALTFDLLIQASIPAWKQKSRELRDLLVQLREALDDEHVAKPLDSIDAQLEVLTQRATADVGLSTWAGSMTPGDEALLDPAEGTPIAWDPTGGWR